MVLKKSKNDNSTLFIDASKYCVKVTNNNKLRTGKGGDIEKILELFSNRRDADNIAKLVPNEEITKQNYNLSVSTYVEKPDTREKIDIDKLNAEIEEIVARGDVLRAEINKIIKEIK